MLRKAHDWERLGVRTVGYQEGNSSPVTQSVSAPGARLLVRYCEWVVRHADACDVAGVAGLFSWCCRERVDRWRDGASMMSDG